MTVQELFQNVDYDDVWNILKKEYEAEDRACEAYRTAFEETKTIDPVSLSTTTIVVIRVREIFEDIEYCYSVFGAEKGNTARYAMEMMPWECWAAYEIHDRSLELYGSSVVVACVLHEMTFFGFTAAQVNNTVRDEVESLMQAERELDEGTSKTYTMEEIYASLDIDEPSEDEKERSRMAADEANMENLQIFRDFFGDEPFEELPVSFGHRVKMPE